MTYAELISTIDQEVRDKRTWPVNAAAAGKLTEQLRIVFGAVLAQAMGIPIAALGNFTAESDLSDTSDLPDNDEAGYRVFSMPENVFRIRNDLGIVTLYIDGVPYDFDEGIQPLYAFKETAGSYFQRGEPFFSIDDRLLLIRSTGTDCTLHYVPLPVLPTPDNYNGTDIPLPPGETDKLVQLTAQHIEAVKNGNRTKSAVHNALSQLYGMRVAS